MPLVVYFDEVGNPALDVSDKDFPVFAIVLLVAQADDYLNQVVAKVNKLKFDFSDTKASSCIRATSARRRATSDS